MPLFPFNSVNNSVRFLVALAAVAGLAWFASSVGAALAPFVFAAVLAYIAAPLAQLLEDRRMPPALVAALVVLFSLLLLITLPLALLPLMVAQVQEFSQLLPPLMNKLHTYLGGDLNEWLAEQDLDFTAIGGSIGGEGAGKVLHAAAGVLGGGISAAATLFTLLLITPLAAFYFLRDRKSIGGELTELLPPHIRERTLMLCRDLDNVLGEFLHGQLMVMSVMAVFYAVVLKLAGLPFALTIGILSGLLTFIPYVGFILGVALATLVGLGSFDNFLDVVIVWLLMGIGTTVETVLITPRLVGERVGLHPLAVLLALMVMGDLMGFVGVLIALPLAAVLLVCGRHLRRRYIGSGFYGNP